MILAVDPGIATCGWAVVHPRTGAAVACGVLVQRPDPKLGAHVDRRRRAQAQAELVVQLLDVHGITRIAAEEMSFAPRSSAAAKIGIGLSWGNLVGIAQARFGRPVEVIAPKTWQRAIVPAEAGEDVRAAIDYAKVYAALERYVDARATGLDRIAPSQRSHALDAVGVGVCVALRTQGCT